MDAPPVLSDRPAPANRTLRRWLIVAVVIMGLVNFIGIFGLLYFYKSQPAPRTSALAAVAEAPPPVATDGRFTLRDARARPNEIDLSGSFNFALNKNWHDVRGNDLAELPTGLQTLAGTRFDVRGLIQVAQRSAVHPPAVSDISVGQVCRRIHFLHAAIGAAATEKGTTIGHYVVHYADGRQEDIPIVAKVNTGDWWEPSQVEELEAVVAWTGQNDKSRPKNKNVRLLKYTWENPRPTQRVTTIDLLAEFAGPSPFLVALTTE